MENRKKGIGGALVRYPVGVRREAGYGVGRQTLSRTVALTGKAGWHRADAGTVPGCSFLRTLDYPRLRDTGFFEEAYC